MSNIGNTGNWTVGHLCPRGSLPQGTFFQGDLGYSLEHAKTLCASACNTRGDCFFTNLYWTISKQTCYLRGKDCGDWKSFTHWASHFYHKGTIHALKKHF